MQIDESLDAELTTPDLSHFLKRNVRKTSADDRFRPRSQPPLQVAAPKPSPTIIDMLLSEVPACFKSHVVSKDDIPLIFPGCRTLMVRFFI